MNDQQTPDPNQPEPEPGDSDAAQPARRKPGFFSRLFAATNTEVPQEPLADEAEEAEVAEAAAEAAEAAAEAEEPKRGVFGRIFGKKKKDDSAAEAPAEEPQPEPAAEFRAKKSWFRRLRDRLAATRQGLIGNLRAVFGLSGKLDEETIEELEAALIQSDVAVETTQRIIERMKASIKRRDRKEGGEVLFEVFREAIEDILVNSAPGFAPKTRESGPYVVMVVGVNGVGKTTTVAKMAKRCTDAGLKTMLVAGDTFRAAAVEQLEIWARRTGCEFVRGAHESDAAALCYDAMAQAKARGVQVVFVDTAGRLHTKSSLMDELGKIERVVKRQIPGAPHETLLVLDATTGQNAIQQVRIFSSAVKIGGLIMTKLDGTARGGVLLSVLDMFRIPITLIGVGEAVDDLRDFDPEQYAAALFGEDDAEKD